MLVDNLNAPESEELHASLSERELQTLQKIASGKKLSEIADELMLSPQDRERLPRPRAGEAAPGEQRRTDGLRDSQQSGVSATEGRLIGVI